MRLTLCIYILLLYPFSLLYGSSNSGDVVAQSPYSINSFIENKGQIKDQYGKPISNALFKSSYNGLDLYITTSGLTYIFSKPHKKNDLDEKSELETDDQTEREENEEVVWESLREDMILKGASIKKENIITEEPKNTFFNYYYAHCPAGIVNVKAYDRITIKKIYPGIDWIIYKTGNGIKYDFIVHPFADPSLIKMNYPGSQPELINDARLQIKTSLGNITEGELYVGGF